MLSSMIWRRSPRNAVPAGEPFTLALAMLARRPLTRAELRERLERKGVETGGIESSIADLESRGFLPPDVAIVRVWAESRARRKGIGRERLARELVVRGLRAGEAKGLAEELLPDLVQSGLLQRELERAVAAMKKSNPSPRGRNKEAGRPAVSRIAEKVFDRLRRKGFPTGEIRRALEKSGLWGLSSSGE